MFDLDVERWNRIPSPPRALSLSSDGSCFYKTYVNELVVGVAAEAAPVGPEVVFPAGQNAGGGDRRDRREEGDGADRCDERCDEEEESTAVGHFASGDYKVCKRFYDLENPSIAENAASKGAGGNGKEK